MTTSDLKVFKGNEIRRSWNDQEEKWYFSVVDITAALSGSINPQAYWRKLKERLKKEGSETVTKCHGLKMQSRDGKLRMTDVADTETIFRLIQSIPSPKAEPFKLWLARVGYERVEEIEDPEKAIQRGLNNYLKRGHSKEWVDLRLKSIEIRKDLTDEWVERGIKTSKEFAILTDEITLAWAGMRTKSYKKYKVLKKQNLRDNMTNLELVLNMLAEASTEKISKKEKPETFDKNINIARKGGRVAGIARANLEKNLGESIISRSSYINERKRIG